MASSKEFFKNLKLSDAQKANMTPEQIARIEAALAELKNVEFTTFQNPDRFDAKGMVPVDYPEGKVIPWMLVEADDAEGGDDRSK